MMFHMGPRTKPMEEQPTTASTSGRITTYTWTINNFLVQPKCIKSPRITLANSTKSFELRLITIVNIDLNRPKLDQTQLFLVPLDRAPVTVRWTVCIIDRDGVKRNKFSK